MAKQSFIHKELAQGKWQELTLFEQLGNIGSEVSRAKNWKEKDEELFANAANRALELFDLTLSDPRWKGRLLEIARAREIFCDVVFGDKKYQTSLEDLVNYFNQFAYAARLQVV